MTGEEAFVADINDVYEKMSVWRKNISQLPKGSTGKNFIKELNKAIDLWNNNSPLRNVALKIVMVLPNLLLQN